MTKHYINIRNDSKNSCRIKNTNCKCNQNKLDNNSFVIFIISLILFIIRELTTKNPIVDIRVFLNKNFLICTILVFIWGFIIFASQYILPVYIARVRELDGTTVASMVYIMGFSQVASGFLALVLFKFFNRRTVAFIGFIMLAIGTWMQGFMISEIGAYEIILPQIIREVSKTDYKVVWACDPMHGNTIKSNTGYKTRPLTNIISEIEQFFKIHRSEGTYPGGIHLEMTGQDVTECIGGIREVTEDDLKSRYHTYCDPRLNASQSLELAFILSDFLKDERIRLQQSSNL